MHTKYFLVIILMLMYSQNFFAAGVQITAPDGGIVYVQLVLTNGEVRSEFIERAKAFRIDAIFAGFKKIKWKYCGLQYQANLYIEGFNHCIPNWQGTGEKKCGASGWWNIEIRKPKNFKNVDDPISILRLTVTDPSSTFFPYSKDIIGKLIGGTFIEPCE